ncbi:hypothetical protein BGP_0121 [Beggiatoa sp. PS]|nr:hypothetical protein BGP_0121 [Beggiatoa sp. PS]
MQFLAPRKNVKEGENQTLSIEVDRSDGCEGEISVNLIATNDSTAKPEQDYTLRTDTRLTWPNGKCDTTQSFTLSLIDDQVFEETEKLILRLQPVTEGLRFGELQQLEITIEDNDEKESVSSPQMPQEELCPALEEGEESADDNNICQECHCEEIPPHDSNDMTLPSLGQGITIDGNQTKAMFRGGIAIDGKTFQSRVWLDTDDEVEIQAEFEPASEHIGENADILIVAHYQLMLEQQWFMKGSRQNIQLWDSISSNLVAVENVKLESTQPIDIYSGLLPPGQLKIYFGYRLQNGLIVFNGEQSIKAMVE